MTDEPGQSGGDGRPKFMNTITGWIGGLTGIVIALAGLFTAIDHFTGDSEANAQQTNSEATENTDATDTATEDSNESTEAVEANAAPLAVSYSGVVTLELDGREWIFNKGQENEATYEQLGGREDGHTYATNYDRDYQLSWPNGGGQIYEKKGDGGWEPLGNVSVVEPAAEETAG